MARKLRLEFPGAIYHVINRGNRRTGPFGQPGTRDAFEACLFEACTRSEWQLHAYAVMSNHFHLALQTPRGNLATGMQWLQATFTNRYNRFRREVGYGSIFQGRYKALLVEPGTALGMLCAYIHLNPVRAGLASVPNLHEWRWSSHRWLRSGHRPPFLSLQSALAEAGELADEPAGWDAYEDYLAWQAAEGPAGKNAAYVHMSEGWALGSANFHAELVHDHDITAISRAWEVQGAAEIARLHAETKTAACLRVLGYNEDDIRWEPKGVPWKLAIAARLKQHTTASNAWIATRLEMGAPARVTQAMKLVRTNPGSTAGMLFQRLGDRLSA